MKQRSLLVLLAVLLGTLGVAGCGSSSEATDPKVIKYGIYQPGTDAGFLLMGQEKGLLEKYGAKVEVVRFNSAQQAFPALLSGQVDMIQGNPSEALLASQRGADIKFVGSTMPGLNYVIYAKPGHPDLASLAGATVGISTPTALPAVVAKEMLAKAGVDLKTVKFVNAGGSPDRYKAVVSGKLDAASSPLDFIAQAKKDDIEVLAKAREVVPDYPRYALIARGDVLERNPDGVTGLIAGLVAGIRYALEHEDEANALTAKTLDLPADAEQVTSTYTEYREGGYLAVNGTVPVRQIHYLADLQRRLGINDAEADVDALIDDSFRAKAIDKLGERPETYYGAKES